MSVFDKLLDSIKLNDDDYDEDNYLDEDLMDDDEGDFLDDDPMDDKPKKKFFEKFGRKKEDDLADEDTSFDEEPVHTATPKTAAKAPAKQPAEKQPSCESGFFYGGLCDQTCFHGGHPGNCRHTS